MKYDHISVSIPTVFMRRIERISDGLAGRCDCTRGVCGVVPRTAGGAQ